MQRLTSWLGLARASSVDAANAFEWQTRLASETFVASLLAARAAVIEDGMQALLKAHEQTIGDDPQFGLPSKFAA
ncbi:MAG: hypothetical protein ABWZ40_10025 [Caulobacterales bacterium]